MTDSDPISDLRSLCTRKDMVVHLPVLVWSILFWLDGFMVGAALLALLARLER